MIKQTLGELMKTHYHQMQSIISQIISDELVHELIYLNLLLKLCYEPYLFI